MELVAAWTSLLQFNQSRSGVDVVRNYRAGFQARPCSLSNQFHSISFLKKDFFCIPTNIVPSIGVCPRKTPLRISSQFSSRERERTRMNCLPEEREWGKEWERNIRIGNLETFSTQTKSVVIRRTSTKKIGFHEIYLTNRVSYWTKSSWKKSNYWVTSEIYYKDKMALNRAFLYVLFASSNPGQIYSKHTCVY